MMYDDSHQISGNKVVDKAQLYSQIPRLLDRVRHVIRCKHYSIRTEHSYVEWIKRYIYFHGRQHPQDMGEQQISAFLTHLAVDRKVAASTQNQALCALVFLYRDVLKKKVGDFPDVVRAKRPANLSGGQTYICVLRNLYIYKQFIDSDYRQVIRLEGILKGTIDVRSNAATHSRSDPTRFPDIQSVDCHRFFGLP